MYLYYLELAKMSDSNELFKLANDLEIRRNSFNEDKINIIDHENWLREVVQQNKSWLYLAKTKDNQLIGSLRFDKKEKNCFVISIQISKNFRGRGFSKRIIIKGIKNLSLKNKNPSITAYIKKDNIKSLRAFISAGFILLGQEFIKNNMSYVLRYEKY